MKPEHNSKRWNELRAFLVRTGDEIRRELEKLVVEIRDPDKAHRVRAGLQHLGSWAKSTAEEVAARVDEVVKRRTGRPLRRESVSPRVESPAPSKQPKSRSAGGAAPASKRARVTPALSKPKPKAAPKRKKQPTR